jgi:hypothetical protein
MLPKCPPATILLGEDRVGLSVAVTLVSPVPGTSTGVIYRYRLCRLWAQSVIHVPMAILEEHTAGSLASDATGSK